MVCRFILGRAGSGKTYTCFSEMARRLREHQTERPLLFLLPEQATFIHERMLAEQFTAHGYAGGEVTSFRRLIWQAAALKMTQALPQLSEAGRSLLMGKLLSSRKGELQVLGSAFLGGGFAGEMVAVAEELMIYGVEPEQLTETVQARLARQERDPLARKLADVALLYTDYVAEIRGQYDNFADGMVFLAQQIAEEGFLAGATIFIDGYSEFTPRELAVLEALMPRVERLEIALALDPVQRTRQLREEDIFYPVWRCYGRLTELARRSGTVVEEPLCLVGEPPRFQENPELAFLEAQCYPWQGRAQWPKEPQHLHLTAAENRRQELEAVGRQILSLVRERGLRFQEISVIARESELYADLLPTVFGTLGIPYFVDAQQPLLYHPLLELLRAALEIWAGQAHYRNMFRYFKTGLTPLSLAETDRLENYCLAHGVRHWQWRQDEDWQYWRGPGDAEAVAEALAEVNALRREGTAALRDFLSTAPAPGEQVPVEALLRELVILLENLKVAETVQAWQDEALRAGQAAEANWHRQAYEKLLGFLAEARLLVRDSRLETQQILTMIDAGCASLTLSMIPPGLDQVLVASLERSRNPELKAAFVIGLNADQLPKKIQPEAIFTDYDRGELEKAGIELAPNTLRRQMAEHYLAYVALTRSGGELYLSYATQGEDGKSLLPSPLLRRIRTLFPRLTTQFYQEEAAPRELAGGQATLATLARKLAEAGEGARLDGFWRDVYNWYALAEGYTEQLRQLAQGLEFQPLQGHLSAETLRQLYGPKLQSSVSRLEKFRACPFAYFASYGLKLRERPEYQITPLERGDIFHQALAEIGRRMSESGGQWAALTEESATALVEEVLAELLPQFLAGILSSTARYRYLQERIKHTLVSTILVMAEHMRRGAFVPVAWELAFGNRAEDALPPLRIPLTDGKVLELNGQIDRVDLAHGETQAYFRIIDYKTGDLSLKVEDVFQGLRLQLLVYLQVVLENKLYFKEEDAAAAGVYYMPVRDQISATQIPPEDTETEDEGGLKLAGLTVLDEEPVRLADPQIKGHSKLIPVALGDGGFYANSPGVSAERLGLLRDHLLSLLQQTAQQLLSGLVEVAPRRGKNFDACAYCDYGSFCGFDGALAQPQHLAQIQAEEIWRILEGGGDDGLST